MKKLHLKEKKVYLISNHAVARNPLFATSKMQEYFKEKIQLHVSPLADIISFNLVEHEFQIMVKLKNREDFIGHYIEKKNYISGDIIPESTYIFSRAKNFQY